MAELEKIKHGIVCFTFDDRNFTGWVKALPLFKKYGAHASFFVHGEINDEAVEAMRLLQSEGHTVGLHTLHHADAPPFFEEKGAEEYYLTEIKPQLDACTKAGLRIHAFSYPNNRRTEETDAYLRRYFQRFRAGVRGVAEEEIRISVSRLAACDVMHGFGIGEYYNAEEGALLAQIHDAAVQNRCITFFSHNIQPQAKFIHMPAELLEKCLSFAQEEGMWIAGLDELPSAVKKEAAQPHRDGPKQEEQICRPDSQGKK